MRYWKTKEVVGNPKIGMVVVAYKRPRPLACLLYSFLAQTYGNFEIIVVHDGPDGEIREMVSAIGDNRIRLIETQERQGHYGHPLRQMGIDLCTADYIGMSNDDNYYVPVYFEWMLHQMVSEDSQFVFCNFVRSHDLWQPYITSPRKRDLDCGGWVASSKLVKSIRWTDMSFEGDGTYIDKLVAAADRITKVDACLFVHN